MWRFAGKCVPKLEIGNEGDSPPHAPRKRGGIYAALGCGDPGGAAQSAAGLGIRCGFAFLRVSMIPFNNRLNLEKLVVRCQAKRDTAFTDLAWDGPNGRRALCSVAFKMV